MRPRVLLLVCLFVLILAVMPSPVAAADGDTSSASITSFSQTNPADGSDFWPDGYNSTTTNSKLYDNMAGVGPWVADGLTGGQTRTTTGDYIQLKMKYTAGTLWKGMYTNRPSFTTASLDNTYFVLRYKGNVTGQTWWGCDFYSADSKGGTLGKSLTLTQTTTWTTLRVYMGDDAQNAESIWLGAKIDSGQAAVEIDYDFLLLTPSNLDGWQNDCSATGNTSATGDVVISSSGSDTVTMAGIASGGTGSFLIDNTATAAGLDTTYYPMLELQVTAHSIFGGTGSAELYGVYGADSTVQIGSLTNVGTYRFNIEAVLSTDYTQIRLNIEPTESITFDWVALYAITNFTATITGATVSDVAYVSSNALGVDKASATLFLFDRDPAISVASATYSRWNITTAAPSAVGCALYVAAWTAKDGESTWAMPTGTTTDVRLRVTADAMISALKFLADASVPICVWSSATPADPTTTDEVTLWAVITDSYALYKVYFRPITYPAGFSTLDYEATEGQENLWFYTFSTLSLSGTYCFVVVGTDGANNNTLGETTYLTFSVREAAITISPISFFGVGDDFAMMTVSFEIDRDATYTVYEVSATYEETDTHTGSVTEGWNNIAWTKLSLTDDMVNFSIKFEAGSLTTWVNGSYAVAKGTFYFETAPITGEGHEYAVPVVWCSGLLSKPATYTVYVDNTESGSGSTTATFYLEVDKGVPRGQDHHYAFRFVNGSQTLWLNCTYYTYAANEDEAELGGGADWRTSQGWWTNLFVFACFLGILYIAFRIGEKKTTAGLGNVPNYGGRKK